MMPRAHVIKLGGSLLEGPDLPDCLSRLSRWLAAEPRAAPECGLIMVVGGGAAADAVRALDQARPMAPERAHWLAIRAMQFNAHFVAAALRDLAVTMVTSRQEAVEAVARGTLAVVEPWEWLRREDAAGVVIPHRWSFTSDSIAAHVATRLGAARLTMLKSTLPTELQNEPVLERAVALGLLDADFVQAARGIPRIELVNLRGQEPTAGTFPRVSLPGGS